MGLLAGFIILLFHTAQGQSFNFTYLFLFDKFHIIKLSSIIFLGICVWGFYNFNKFKEIKVTVSKRKVILFISGLFSFIIITLSWAGINYLLFGYAVDHKNFAFIMVPIYSFIFEVLTSIIIINFVNKYVKTGKSI